jgi:hypothetical protein
MYRWVVLVAALIAAAPSASAEGCVAGIAIVVSSHGDNRSTGDVVFVNNYKSIKVCNEAMAKSSNNPLSGPAPEDSAPFESFTYTCKVPPDCDAPDAGEIQPIRKVVIWAK